MPQTAPGRHRRIATLANAIGVEIMLPRQVLESQFAMCHRDRLPRCRWVPHSKLVTRFADFERRRHRQGAYINGRDRSRG